jgi:hypothetical protein
VVVTAGEGLGRGFRGEVVGFDDGSRSTAARFVWTDDRGDRIYGSLRGEALETGGRSTGSITGGSGRYAGLTGDVELSWQYVVRAGDGAIQCRTTALKGRYRRAAAQP